MPCNKSPSEVIALSPSAIVNIFVNPVNSNVTSLCINNCLFQNLCIVNDTSRIHNKSHCVKLVPVVEMSGVRNNNPRYSNVSQNVEDNNVVNDVRQQQQDQSNGQDSGFCSGGSIRSDFLSCREDHEILMSNESELTDCSFYYPNLDSVGAMKKLKLSSVGTFLIRNSLDAKFLYSLSVKTQRGATSVRIAYQEGWFSFDCDERIRKRMPRFHSVLELVDHYVDLSRQGMDNSWRWEEKSGRKNMVVEISKPCRTSVPSLQHLSTIVLNQNRERLHSRIAQQPIKHGKVFECLRNYPFKV